MNACRVGKSLSLVTASVGLQFQFQHVCIVGYMSRTPTVVCHVTGRHVVGSPPCTCKLSRETCHVITAAVGSRDPGRFPSKPHTEQ